MRSITRRRTRALSPTTRVTLLVVTLIVVDLALLVFLRHSEPLFPRASVPFVVLVTAFALVEWRVIHIQFRAEASSFSLLEVPLVLGLLYASPAVLIGAAMLGMVFGLWLGRHQSPLKIAFNVANIGLYAGIAWLVVHQLAGGRELDPATWAVVFVATAAGTTVTVGAILGAITLTEGPPDLRAAARLVGFALAMSSANTALGLVAAILFPSDALGIALLLVPAAMVLLAFQMFASERAQRERVEFLYRSSRLLETTDANEAPGSLLAAAREMFRAGLAALVLLPDEDMAARAWILGDGDLLTQELGETAAGRLRDAFDALEHPATVHPDADDALARVVRNVGGRDAIAARMATDERDLGILVVADRLGEVTAFSEGDLHILAALATQSGVLLHNDRLEHALAELQELERQLAHQATHDTLTGLPNRSLFTRQLDEIAAGTESFAVLFLDLDDFKIVNDTRGHAAGDQLLTVVAERVRNVLRPVDTAARFGGDEFAVIVRDHCYPREVADRIVARVSEPIELEGGPVQVGCSVGIAVGDPHRDPEILMQHADVAMYQAKRAGKRGVVEYTPGIEGGRELDFRAGLRAAFAQGQLELHYQPIVDLVADRVCGLEALVRWRTRSGELLMPDQFILQAEQDGFIIPIDRWVLEQATADLRRLDAECPGLFVSVNISARHLREPDLVDHVAGLELTSGSLAERMVLEVTETALMGEIDRSRSNVDAIRELGVRLALDDFGTGYSSIGYLREFDIDILKIARPFVAAAVRSPRDREFVEAMIELGHALGLEIVGEGVEMVGEAAALAALGCEMAQGYLFARPVPFDEISRLLRREAQLPTGPIVGLSLR